MIATEKILFDARIIFRSLSLNLKLHLLQTCGLLWKSWYIQSQ